MKKEKLKLLRQDRHYHGYVVMYEKESSTHWKYLTAWTPRKGVTDVKVFTDQKIALKDYFVRCHDHDKAKYDDLKFSHQENISWGQKIYKFETPKWDFPFPPFVLKWCHDCKLGNDDWEVIDNYDEDVVLTTVKDPDKRGFVKRALMCGDHFDMYDQLGYDLYVDGKLANE